MSDGAEKVFLHKTVAGHYYIDRLLGTGSFAWVYHAYSQRTGMEVAIKVLSSAENTATMRFAREVEVLKALPRCPNVVGFVEEGKTPDGWPLMVLEYVDGITLRDGMNRCRALAAPKAVAFMTELCGAFVGLHELGVAHRDIKPENVLLPRTGGIKLIDFGLIRDAQGLLKLLEAQDPLDRRLFELELDQWTVAGTPEYMAPEQFADAQIDDLASGRTDTWSDVFSLGVILCQLLTGQKLFPMRIVPDAEFAAEMITYMKWRLQLTDESIPSFTGIDAALDSILRKSLRQDPRRRQPDARALLEDLKRWERTGKGVSSSDDSRTQMHALDDVLASPSSSERAKESPPVLFTPSAQSLPDFDEFDDDDRTDLSKGLASDGAGALGHAGVFFGALRNAEEPPRGLDEASDEAAEIQIMVEEAIDGYTIEVDDALVQPETGAALPAADALETDEAGGAGEEAEGEPLWREQTPTNILLPEDVDALLEKVKRYK